MFLYFLTISKCVKQCLGPIMNMHRMHRKLGNIALSLLLKKCITSLRLEAFIYFFTKITICPILCLLMLLHCVHAFYIIHALYRICLPLLFCFVTWHLTISLSTGLSLCFVSCLSPRRPWWTTLCRWSLTSPTSGTSWCWWHVGNLWAGRTPIRRQQTPPHHRRSAGCCATFSPRTTWVAEQWCSHTESLPSITDCVSENVLRLARETAT